MFFEKRGVHNPVIVRPIVKIKRDHSFADFGASHQGDAIPADKMSQDIPYVPVAQGPEEFLIREFINGFHEGSISQVQI
jgi:hypothetical protein